MTALVVTALVVVALLVGFAIGGLLRRAETMAARRRVRQWRWSSQRWQAEAAEAWKVIAYLEDENSQLKDDMDNSWDARRQDGVGIRVDLGEVDP